jgi:hypothetical protein
MGRVRCSCHVYIDRDGRETPVETPWSLMAPLQGGHVASGIKAASVRRFLRRGCLTGGEPLI